MALAAQAQAPPPPLSETAWRQDLDIFAAQFPRSQMDFPKVYQYAGFYSALGTLRSQLGSASDGEIALGLMRLVASANIAHTTVETPHTMGFFRRLPVTLHWYPDGLAITAAASEYSDAIGARVVSIGVMTPDQILTAISPFISHENTVWLRREAPALLGTMTMMQHLGLIDANGRAVFTLLKPGRAPFTLSIPIADPRVKLLDLTEGPPHAPVPLYRSRPNSYYWYRFLNDSQTMYIQYNRCEEDPQLPFAKFASEVLAEIDRKNPRRVVIDLRQNTGGNSAVIDPLKRGLASRTKLARSYSLWSAPRRFPRRR
jgi:hypothetical protein